MKMQILQTRIEFWRKKLKYSTTLDCVRSTILIFPDKMARSDEELQSQNFVFTQVQIIRFSVTPIRFGLA